MKERGRRVLKAREEALKEELLLTKQRLAAAEDRAKKATAELEDLRRYIIVMRRENNAFLKLRVADLEKRATDLEFALRQERAVAKAAAKDREDAYAILAEADRKVAAARSGRFPAEHVQSFRVRAKRHIAADP